MKLTDRRSFGLLSILSAADLSRVLRIILGSLLGFLLLGTLAYLINPVPASLSVTRNSAVMAAATLASLMLVHRGRPTWAVVFMLGSCGAVLLTAAWQGAGIFGPAYACLSLLVLGVSMYWGQRAGILAAALASLSGLGLVLAARAGYLEHTARPVADWFMWATLSAIFILLTAMIGVALTYLESMLLRERAELDKRDQAEHEIRRLNQELEQRIAQRTAELAESERLLNLITANVRDVIWISDMQLNITYTTRPDANGEPGRRGLKGLTAESRARVLQAMREELELESRTGADRGRSRVLEVDSLRADGSLARLEIRASFLRDKAGQAVGVIGVNRDVSERSQMESALRASEERYRRIASVISDYSYSATVDAHGNYEPEWVAGAFEAITGYEFNDYLAHGGWPTLLHPDSQDQDQRDRARLFANQPIEGSLLCIRRKDGELRWVRNFAHPVWHPLEDRLAGVYGGVQDITAAKLAEDRLKALNDALEQRVAERTTQFEQALEELEAFSYAISHELRAPLRAIHGYAGILLQDHQQELPEPAVERIRQIQHSGMRMGRLVDGLLQFLRDSRAPIQPQLVQPAAIVQKVLERLAPQIRGRRVEIALGDLPACSADARLLEQVYQSLIGNAIKFTRDRDPARIEIGALIKDGHQVYFVRDNGAGFDMRYYDKLFNVFQRLHHLNEFEGVGVSLAIIQRIIHRHGGRIWAQGEVDRGATFYFQLSEPQTV